MHGDGESRFSNDRRTGRTNCTIAPPLGLPHRPDGRPIMLKVSTRGCSLVRQATLRRARGGRGPCAARSLGGGCDQVKDDGGSASKALPGSSKGSWAGGREGGDR